MTIPMETVEEAKRIKRQAVAAGNKPLVAECNARIQALTENPKSNYEPSMVDRYLARTQGETNPFLNLIYMLIEIAYFPFMVIGYFFGTFKDDLKGHPNPYPYLGDNHKGSPW